MIKRMLVLATLVFAVAVPTALAETGSPPAPAAGSARAGQLQQRLEALRQRVDAVAVAFHRHCVVHVTDVGKCTDVANRGVTRLQTMEGNVGKLIARVQQHGGPHADQVVTVLQNVQSKLGDLQQKLQDWLANPPAPTSSGSSSGSSSTGTDGLEPLDQLGSDLAAARSAAQQSGIK